MRSAKIIADGKPVIRVRGGREVPVYSIGSVFLVRTTRRNGLTAKELALLALVYNLVRSVTTEPARVQGVAPERISVADTIHWLIGSEGDGDVTVPIPRHETHPYSSSSDIL